MKTFEAQFFDLTGYEPKPYELALLRGHSIKEVIEQHEVPGIWVMSDDYNKVLFISYLIGNPIRPDEVKCIDYRYMFLFCVIANLKGDNQLVTNIIKSYQSPDIAMIIDHLNKKVADAMDPELTQEFFNLAKTWVRFDDHDYPIIIEFLEAVFDSMYRSIIIENKLHVFNHNPNDAICYNVMESQVRCSLGFWLLLCYVTLLIAISTAFILNYYNALNY